MVLNKAHKSSSWGKKRNHQKTKKMTTKIGSVFLIMVLITSCQPQPKKNTSETPSEMSVDINQFIGSWVQPNPINKKGLQGFKLKKDGTAESINLATLKYRNWWYESGELNLVVESIGNKISFTDTVKYEVTKITDKELEFKNGQIIERYEKQ